MSNIPHPEVVAQGSLPSVEEMLGFAEEVIEHFSTDEVQLVCYGSLARQDATWRSDIDLCATPPTKEYLGFSAWEVELWSERELARRGWNTCLSVLDCASKRGDAEHNRHRLNDPSDPQEAIFSITTFDHFRFLAQDKRFPSETRRLYSLIQADVRKCTGTNQAARLRDLTHYVRECRHRAGLLTNINKHPHEWRGYPDVLSLFGWAENVSYHVLRKLAGLAKALHGTDSKATLAECFDPQVPFFAALLEHFSIVRQFSLDIEDILISAFRRPDLSSSYADFLDQRIGRVAEATIAILGLLYKEIEERTLLETIAGYDRDAPKAVLLDDRHDYCLSELRKDEIWTAIHWWCIGNKVYVASPSRAYIDYRGEVLPLGANAYFNGKKLNPRLITAEGRFEISFGPEPEVKDRYLYARPTRKDRPDYQQAAELAYQAVLAKLQEMNPADIILAPSP